MAHSLTSNDKHHDLAGGEDYRWPGGYRFARTPGRRARARTAISRINGYLRTVIEAVADSKMRRIERELELRGIQFDRRSNNWVTRNSAPTERSR